MRLETRKDSGMGRITIHDLEQDGLEIAWIRRWFHGAQAEVPETGWSIKSSNYDQVVRALYEEIERYLGEGKGINNGT